MPIIPAQIAIANLIDSAEKGEIDPWDVPVIETIDLFLKELGLIENAELSIAEANLPQSGQAFLWASMLVLLKADTLELLQDESEVEDEFSGEFDLDIERSPSLPPFFEQHLRRRTSVPSRGKRRVTLQELIEQLEQIAAEIEASTTGETKPKNAFSSRRAAMKAISDLAHNENLTELAIQLENFLLKKFPQLSASQDFLNWEHLLTHWHQDRPQEFMQQNHSEDFDRAGIFWALLLLSAQSKIELSQEEFYQDLSIRLPIDL
jgi:segregation and condensation protein A